ncbi:glutathione S-transferase family protein [Shewanella salipaludis]|uniref:Glutathione S-transferase family protein n=1 Tax=Shewanella salipaludis TaxID=2723052 RepID=A0A972FQU4_9GAMM|nr:glutathione S-transferase family protein [Shewanella salipaludis]NMH64473.1 glutathione S-transferase family protein [Shewanella salipaludis]
MLTLYIANKNYSSWSLRPWILMTQLGLTFEEKLVPFGGQENASRFSSFSPTAKVPCLQDGEILVWDSLAIIEYLAEQVPEIWPADRVARAWARCAAAEMHSGFGAIRNGCTMNCGLRVRLHQWPDSLEAEWRRIDSLWQQGLTRFGGPFLAGEHFSAVDAFFAPLAFRAQSYAPPLSASAQAYVQHLLALPGMQAWYEAALAEPWRDEEHETEAREAGVWLEDLRTN